MSSTTGERDPKVAEADALAAHHHAGQIDKAGAPYIGHCRAVAAAVASLGADFEIVALLHDTLEDTDLTAAEIERRFGPKIRAAVEAMTKRPGENYFKDYLPRALADPLARAVKRADVAHNLGRLDSLPPGPTRDRLRAKYERVIAAITGTQDQPVNSTPPAKSRVRGATPAGGGRAARCSGGR